MSGRKISAPQARAFAKRVMHKRHPDVDLTVEFEWLGEWCWPRCEPRGELIRCGRVTVSAPGFKTARLRLHASTVEGCSIF